MKGLLCQSLAAVILSIPNFLTATSITWTSYTEDILVGEESPIGVPLTRSQVSMVASFMLLGAMAAVVTTWQLPEMIGRRNSELLVGILMTLSWCLIATAHSALQIIAARAIFGFGMGLHFMVCPVYINEFSQPSIRGAMNCVPLFFYSVGSLMSFLIGWFCTYNFIVYTNLVISVMYTVSVNFMNESPVFLVTKRKEKESLKSLKFYRGTSKTTPAVLEELQYLKKQQDAAFDIDETAPVLEKVKLNAENMEVKTVADGSPFRILFTMTSSRRTLTTLGMLCVFVCLMGFLPLQAYAGQIFKIAAPGMSPHLCSVIMAVSIAAGNGLAVFITDLLPRRVLSLATGVLCAASLVTLSSLLRWSWAPSWTVPISVLAFNFFFTTGIGNMPMVQLSESFTPKVKVLASAIYNTLMFGTNFVLISSFGHVVDLLGLDGTFFAFSIISTAATVLAFLIMKETRGVPLENIQGMYDRGFLYWK